VFDREAVWIERRLQPWTKDFPGLKFVLAHISSKIAVDYIRSAAPQVGATITPYHLTHNRTDWLGWGNRPYLYCMPVIKTETDRRALVESLRLFASLSAMTGALAAPALGAIGAAA
jgi:dihydroorotase